METVTSIRATIGKEKDKEKEFSNIKTDDSIQAIGLRIRCTEKEFSHGLLEKDMKENTMRTRNMERAD